MYAMVGEEEVEIPEPIWAG